MFYTYILRSKINLSYYVGSTGDLRRRFNEHNLGLSRYTARYRPWELVYYEAFLTKDLAIKREFALKKRTKSWQELLKRLGIER